jgi:hypothetical protein
VGSFSRKQLLARGGTLALAGAGLGVLPGAARAGTTTDNDLAFARLLVVAELLAIDFYERVLRSHRHPATAELRRSLYDERRHREAAANVLVSAGQVPPGPADVDFVYPKHSFASHESMVALGAQLESIFLGAYLGAVAGLDDPGQRLSAARAAASEAQHLCAFTGRVGPAFPHALPIDQASNALSRFTA